MKPLDDTEDLARCDRSPQQVELCVVVGADGLFASYPVPRNGTVTIGRAHDNDIRVEHRSVSRHHAVLDFVATEITIRDLGSANGTMVAGQELVAEAPVGLGIGEMVQLGGVTLLVQRSTGQTRASGWNTNTLSSRLHDECARSSRSQSSFTYAIVRVEGQADSGAIGEVFDRSVRACDAVGTAGNGNYELLLVDVDPSDAQPALDRLRQSLRDAGVDAALGIAGYPRDGTSPEQIIAHAWNQLRREHVGGGAGGMARVHALIDQVAESTLSVLIRGETGVGKEVCAELIHRKSARSKQPFLKLNCAALSESLLESELFGHERGAFTGAVAAKQGLLETADGGTVFLDEIGDLPPALQVKLLRVLEDRTVTRVGGLESRVIDVRFVAATNADLEREIRGGRFRSDLYYRLAGITVEIPPLRERTDEIEGLARAFITRACNDARRAFTPTLSPDAALALERHPWPGNIRQLRNTVERAVLLCGAGPILVDHLELGFSMDAPARLDTERTGGIDRAAADEWDEVPPTQAVPRPRASEVYDDTGSRRTLLRGELAELEKRELMEALVSCGGNQTRAAKLLGISRGTLQTRMDAHDIPRPRKRRTKP